MDLHSDKLNISAIRAMSPRGLRGLAAVARTGSYAAAADMLGLTAPALHAQIRSLESALGVPVLRRAESGGSELTEIGARVTETATMIELQLERMAEDVSAILEGRIGRVVLATVSTAKYFAPFLVQRLRQEMPEADIQLRVGNRQQIIDGIASGRFDLAIMGRPPRRPTVEAAIFADHPHILVAPAGHPLTTMAEVPSTELYHETFLLREDGSGTRILAIRWLDRIGEGFPFEQIEMDSNETIKQAVMAGMGLALLSQHTVVQELADGRLKMLPMAGLPIIRHWYVVRSDARPPSPAQESVWQLLCRPDFIALSV